MNVRRSVCLVVAGIVTIASSGQAQNDPVIEGDALSKAELLVRAHMKWDAVKDLSVTFTFNAVNGPAGSITRYWATVLVKGEKVSIHSRYGTDQISGGRTFDHKIAFNGRRTTLCQSRGRVASVVEGRPDEASTEGLGFFDLAMFNQRQVGGIGWNDTSLISLLSSNYATVRPKREAVGKVACDVVDLRMNGQVQMTVWVDSTRGCVPLRWVTPLKGSPEVHVIDYRARDIEMIAPGIWFATSGTKRVHLPDRTTGEITETLTVMEVQRGSDGRCLLQVNSGIDDGEFDLWKHLPEGTEIAGDVPEGEDE